MPKVSVIIPTFNCANYVITAINSALKQTLSDLEVIVIDDGSKDNTFELLKNITDNKVKYIRQENRGVSNARNTGIKISKSEFIAFLDADDTWEDDYIENQVSFMNENKCNISYTSCFKIDEKKNIRKESKKKKNKVTTVDLLEWGNVVGTPSRVCIKKKVLEKFKFDETLKIGEDWDLWLRISQEENIFFIDKPLVNYLVRENSASDNLLLRVNDTIELLNKFFYRENIDDKILLKKKYYLGKYHLKFSYLFLSEKLFGLWFKHITIALILYPRFSMDVVQAFTSFCIRLFKIKK